MKAIMFTFCHLHARLITHKHSNYVARQGLFAFFSATNEIQTGSVFTSASLSNESELEKIGASLSKVLTVGDSILLKGDLGAGKTTLARGFIRAKCADDNMRVTSPTYLLNSIYEYGDEEEQRIHHMDLYRLPRGCDLDFLSIPSIYDTSICLVEWPERMRKNLYPKQYMDLRIKISDDQKRTVQIKLVGHNWGGRKAAVDSALRMD